MQFRRRWVGAFLAFGLAFALAAPILVFPESTRRCFAVSHSDYFHADEHHPFSVTTVGPCAKVVMAMERYAEFWVRLWLKVVPS